jgi:hypothetical protein
VDPEGDIVGGRLVLLEEVVLHPAHHVHCLFLLICLQIPGNGYRSMSHFKKGFTK